jgi:hypothetical protein
VSYFTPSQAILHVEEFSLRVDQVVFLEARRVEFVPKDQVMAVVA